MDFGFCALLLLTVLLALVALWPAHAQFTREPLKGFRWVPEYYPATNGTQRFKTKISGSEAQFLSNGLVWVTLPRIEAYREDGSLEWVATSLSALVDMFGKSAAGTNWISLKTGETNFYQAGRGFHWHQSNSVFIISNQTYTWIDRTALTNSPSAK